VRENQPTSENRRFGSFLRGLREDRRLSLEAVEEMSLGLPERVTKSHLSRIENGRAIPTFPRMFTLSQIYGIPVAYLAERFEISLMREMFPSGATEQPVEEVIREARELERKGHFREALLMYEAVADRERSRNTEPVGLAELELHCVHTLTKLGRWSTAKEDCERLLSSPVLTQRQKVIALQSFAVCCYKLGKHTVALMAIESADAELAKLEDRQSLGALLVVLKGNVHFVMRRFDAAVAAFRDGVRQYEKIGNVFESCRARLNLAAALIELGSRSRAREILGQALRQAEGAGFDRQQAYALSHLAALSFKESDLDSAEAYGLRSNSIARPREYQSLLWRNCYYLWKIARSRNDDAAANSNERTLRTYLNRAEGYMPEVEDFKSHLLRGQER